MYEIATAGQEPSLAMTAFIIKLIVHYSLEIATAGQEPSLAMTAFITEQEYFVLNPSIKMV
jgi:hypothetical protein